MTTFSAGAVAPASQATAAAPETLVQFGNGGQLVGNVTHAAPRDDAGPGVGLLLFNAGVVSRMGPHRFNVKLARRLARLGYCSLRFDLSGQGDSGAAPGTLDYHEQTAQDIRDATDQLAHSTGVQRFVIVGICSAAQAGWHAALRDPRIVGLAMIDGHVYPTRWTPLAHRWQRWRERSKSEQFALMAKMLRRIGTGGKSAAVSPRDAAAAPVDADVPVAPTTRDEYARGMQHLVDRGTRLMVVFTSGWMRYYSYAGQFAAVFGAYPFCKSVQLEFAPGLDHTLTLLEGQDTMMEWVEQWIAKC